MLDSTGSGLNSDIGQGITWAVDHGANLINISIGLFNLFPVLPFDGGHVVIATYEQEKQPNG